MSYLIAQSRRSRTLGVAAFVGAAVLGSACTSSSNADEALTPPEPVVSTTVDVERVADLAEIEAGNGLPVHGDLPASAPTRLTVAGLGDAGTLDVADGSFHSLASTRPLEIGTDPSHSERFTAVALADGGRIFLAVESPDGDSIVRGLAPSGELALELAGGVVAADSVGSRVAVGNGNELLIVDVAARVAGEATELPGRIDSVSWSPGGSSLAVGWTSSGGKGITLVAVDRTSVSNLDDYPTPGNSSWHHPTWLGRDRLAVVEQELRPTANTVSGVAADGPPLLIVIDTIENRRVEATLLPEAVIDLDAAPDGSTLAVVTASGAVDFWSGGVYGNLDDGPWISARW